MATTAAPALPDTVERLLPAGTRRSLVAADAYRMHVMECGSGRPVLLVHGNPTWSFLWRKVAAALAGEPLRLVMPDLIGLGLSDRPADTGEHTIDNHARWLGAAVDALALRDVVLVLHDWGGPIGLRLIAERPSLARGLVLTNTVVGPPRPGFRPAFFHRFARWPLVSDLAFRVLGFPQAFLHRAQGDPASIRGEVAEAYRLPLRGLGRNAAPLALARMVPDSDRHPSLEPLRRCQAAFESFAGPIALVWGERDPILGRVVSHVARLRPDAALTRTPGGHFLQEETPGPIAHAIREVAGRAG